MKNNCPRCQSKMKSWDELTEDEKMVVRVKPSDFSPEQRKKHSFCVRCGFEETQRETRV